MRQEPSGCLDEERQVGSAIRGGCGVVARAGHPADAGVAPHEGERAGAAEPVDRVLELRDPNRRALREPEGPGRGGPDHGLDTMMGKKHRVVGQEAQNSVGVVGEPGTAVGLEDRADLPLIGLREAARLGVGMPRRLREGPPGKIRFDFACVLRDPNPRISPDRKGRGVRARARAFAASWRTGSACRRAARRRLHGRRRECGRPAARGRGRSAGRRERERAG